MVETSSVGQVPEWPNGADCKSAVFDFRGSNPLLPTSTAAALAKAVIAFAKAAAIETSSYIIDPPALKLRRIKAEVAQLVERQPSKL